MTKTISNQKAKNYSKIGESFKQSIKSATIQGVASGYRALAKIITDRIDKGYSIEEIKTFCNNIDKEYKAKSEGIEEKENGL